MIYIAVYLLVGLVFIAILDTITSRHMQEENQLTAVERFWVATLWPINGSIFIYHFVKEWLKSTK
jgi:hypothetical protein|tara:strand:+ start:605 stop:799 length:195 start_codon:yes stop_codon:yes gene_type:complete